MALPPRSLLVGILVQNAFVFNPGAPVARDLALMYYDQSYFRDIDVRRVLVVDKERKAALLTTPMRVMSAWWARERSGPTAPYLAISGWQDPIPSEVATRYLSALASGRSGSVVSVGGSATVNAVAVGEKPDAAKPEPVLEGVTSDSACWLRMFGDNLAGIDGATSYIADSLDFSVPASLRESGKVVMLLREEESDVAMGSPMLILDDDGNIAEGIQFRGGYGAKWDDGSPHIELRNPYYSPRHRSPASNRIWPFGGQCLPHVMDTCTKTKSRRGSSDSAKLQESQ